MSGKNYKSEQEKMPKEAVSLQEAVTFLKSNSGRKFDETIEVHVRLGVDASKSEQTVKGSAQLPSGSVRKKRVAVFTSGDARQADAKSAGADIVGGEELIKTIAEKGNLDTDIVVATPEMMPKLAKIARILGPKGLMPNPKVGTVTTDVAKTIADLLGGKISFKMDQSGNIHEAVGKVSWDAEKTIANIEAVLEAVKASRPATAKGQFITGVTVCSTMSPGVSVNI